MRRYLFAFIAAMFLSTTSVLAGDKPTFKEADDDHSGKVSMDEATQVDGITQEEVRNADMDNDGKLSKSDWQSINMKRESREDSS